MAQLKCCKNIYKLTNRVVSSMYTRLKYFLRKVQKMRHVKTSFWFMTSSSILVTFVIYNLYRFPTRDAQDTNASEKTTTAEDDGNFKPMVHVALDEIYKNLVENDTDYSFEREEYSKVEMISTAGCKIPAMMVAYEKQPAKNMQEVCEIRAVFLNKIDDNRIRVSINEHVLKNNTNYTDYKCCLRFSWTSKGEELKNVYSGCYDCKDGEIFSLESDFITVRCFGYDEYQQANLIYDDVYAFCKKKEIPSPPNRHCKERYNVLMLGIDSMSLPRFIQTMTNTVAFMKNNYWLSFRGYHKVADNTFPNLMAAMSGLNQSFFSNKCAGEMDECNELLMWSTFKESGYVTAYGEDNIHLPDTFGESYMFKKMPTDHYMRPFFELHEETRLFDKIPYVCSGKVTSGQQLLDYAHDFVSTYRNDSFFGLFWMNSFSHNPMNRPEDADKMFENFFNRLFYTGALKNTFIIFFSDHGLRFGKQRLQVEGYYDDRLPFLFVLPPTIFKQKHPEKYKSMAINQFRLVTPYDVHKTMVDLFRMSMCTDSGPNEIMQNFRNHQSIFGVISGCRTCRDVRIHDKWCSCHTLYPLDEHDTEGAKAIQFLNEYIRNKSLAIVTIPCSKCESLKLDSVVRIHFYYGSDKVSLYYVIAVKYMPRDVVYEATVLRYESRLEIVGSINILSFYKGFGSCTERRKDRIFCVCKIDC